MRRRRWRHEGHPSWFRTPLLAGALLALCAGAAAAQAGVVRGTVTEARTGHPVVGATVTVEGTSLSAMVDGEGRYQLAEVPAGRRTVIARALGHGQARRVVEVGAGAETSVDFVLEVSAIELDQIVVTGTAGGARLRTIGSSVAVVDAAGTMELARAPDLTSLLNARAPGVRLAQATGRLGANASIDVRGRSSLGLGNDPLIYIDGVRVNSETGLAAYGGQFGAQGSAVRGRLNDIHPEDIEHIEVIKGPAAAAIYGTEASNGVIQIITKRGAPNQDPQLTLRMQYGSVFFRDAEGRLPTNYFRAPSGEIVPWNGVRQERSLGRSLFRRGHGAEVHASLSGGSETLRYYASAAYQDEEGVEPNNFGNQFTLHTNVDVEITPRLTFGTSLGYTQIESHLGTDQGASAMLGATCGHELVFTSSRGFCLGFPPELTWELWDNSDVTTRFTASGTVAYRMTDWLSHRLLVGVDDLTSDARALERFAGEDLAVFLPPAIAAGRIGQILRDRRSYTLDYSGTAETGVSASVRSRSSAGVQLDRREARNSSLGGIGFPAAGIELISATATPLPTDQTELVNTTVGAYVQQQFGWHDRLFLTGALRVDNNSAFGEDLRWVTYPKAQLAWIVSEEPFWPWAEVINTFRVRTAYGESGRAPATFSALRTFEPVQGPGGTNAVSAGSLGNPNLKPERGKEWELGFEALLLDRLTLDFTYFNKRTTDLIVNQPVAPSTGFSGTVPRNLGRVDNSGFELAAGFDALRGRRLGWHINANFAVSEDEIRDLGDVPPALTASGASNQVGHPIGGFWSRRIVSADLDPATGQPVNVLCDSGSGGGPVPCAEAPLVFLGRPVPKTTGAVGNTLTIGDNLRLYALVDFASGHLRWNTDEQLRCTGLVGVPLCEVNWFPERFSPIHVAQARGAAVAQNTLAHYYQDAGFVKLREVSLSYSLPDGWIPGTSRASITLAGRELATWSDYGGVDPENGGQAILPPLSRLTATLNIGF